MGERSAIEVVQQRSADLMQQRSADLMQQRSVEVRRALAIKVSRPHPVEVSRPRPVELNSSVQVSSSGLTTHDLQLRKVISLSFELRFGCSWTIWKAH